MAKCGFCHRKFRSEQAVKAHMKRCDLYQTDKRKKAGALGNLPKADVTSPPVQPNPPVTPDLTAPLRDFIKSISEFSTKQDAPQTPHQQRRSILQAAKAQVIDHHYGTPLGHVTASLRGDAKLAIEEKSATLPLEELPFEEVCEFVVAIHDPLYASAFKRQALEANRQRVEEATRQKNEREALGALIRADRRKKVLIQQASHQAHAYCQEKKITGWAHASVLSDVESRLEVFLKGDEPILEAQAIARSVLDGRFAEAEATLAAARAKADAQWHEDVEAVLVLGAVVGLVAFGLHYYPAQMVAIFEWIERTFGLAPGAETSAPNPGSSEKETTPPAAGARPRSRRWRKYPVAPPSPESPWGNPVGGAPGHA
jgi:hypothetical protein